MGNETYIYTPTIDNDDFCKIVPIRVGKSFEMDELSFENFKASGIFEKFEINVKQKNNGWYSVYISKEKAEE